MANARIRHDVWGLSVKTAQAAQTQPWHPVLDGYARAVAAMQSLPATQVNSWLWAANTHGTPPGTPASPWWNQCAHGSHFFLPWHRGYLRWFEKIVSAHLGDDNWALPYWDYSDPANPNATQIPPEFTVPTRTVDGASVPNPLFLDATDRPGQPVAEDVDIVSALSETLFVDDPTQGFGGVTGPEPTHGMLEQLPHDFVHVDIGGDTGLMRTPSLAARDPIFWLHHSNIDRLWEIWRGLSGSLELTAEDGIPAGVITEWNSADFTFGGPNAIDRYSIDQLLDMSDTALNYAYEVTAVAPSLRSQIDANRGQGVMMAVEDAAPGPRPHGQWHPVAATPTTTKVGSAGANRALTFDSHQLTLVAGAPPATPAGLLIKLSGVRAPVDCYNVYFVEVAAHPGAPTHRAGRFATFGLSGTPAHEERNYLIDASAVIGDLVADGWTGEGLVVHVLPDTRGAAPNSAREIRIRQISVYRQQ
ncbi:MAG TPA: tyrosinase family protein [Mycobacterium sp.]|nr:tyrosinase family protein [Mycobacterium sp.]